MFGLDTLLGLSQKEVSIYTTLLKIGSQPASIIAKHAGLNRTAAYTHLDSLTQKGLVVESHTANYKKYSAQDPNKLMDILKGKRVELDTAEKELQTTIQTMSGFLSSDSNAKVMFYEGKEAAENLIYEALDSKDKYVRLGLASKKSGNLFLEVLGRDEFIKKCRSKKVRMDMMLGKNVMSKSLRADSLKDIYDVKFYSTDRYVDCGCLFYDNSILICFFNRSPIYTILIQSQVSADMGKLFFDVGFGGIKLV